MVVSDYLTHLLVSIANLGCGLFLPCVARLAKMHMVDFVYMVRKYIYSIRLIRQQ